ncbi:GMC oxidoreductase-domain-containing protein [Corynascus novoguineensis]|uniref:GMC oxidoreductase-domain-containing protein n=1 Tax=Corynascus novoguineensis TaxID=1126955 RepID=A0AAN7HKJ2_9PEZI|nr:GMC oxidoreductase-domain-containing protein [Corynascus novoguineensis]
MARSSSGLRALLLRLSLALTAYAAPTDSNSAGQADYVIVGGGPAGFVLAEYLTRNPKTKVVLLEAGEDTSTNQYVTTPAEFFLALGEEGIIWDYSVQPDPTLDGLAPTLAQGKSLGGGTAVNAMAYCRGAASVYDEWAEISGNAKLGWSGMLEAFKATTHWNGEVNVEYDMPVNSSSFGNGPLEISRQSEQLTFDQPYVDTVARELQVPVVDFVSGDGIGVSQGLQSIRVSNRTRSYAYNTFGYLANTRPNFQLRTSTWASKIGFSRNKTANSVQYNDVSTGKMRTVRGREIIVAAGAINSPQLLMLSGIGPAATLRQHGIGVVHDSPEVGQNLIDHHYAVIEYTATPEVDTMWQWRYNASRADIEAADYAKDGSGMLGLTNGAGLGAQRLPDAIFEGTGDFQPSLPEDRPHVAYLYSTTPFLYGTPNVSVLSGFAAVTQPESRGNVTLASADYRDAPLIFGNWWGAASDRAAVLAGYKQLRQLFALPELAAHTITELYPGANVTTDEELWAAIQQSSQSWHHPVGTTALGTVLGSDWRVKGVNGLRVVGASAIPVIPTCPIQAAVYALAYRAAVDIAEADGRRP